MKRNPVIPSLFAPDIEATLRFYVDVLGFEKTGEWLDKQDISWAEVTLGSSQIWFFKHALDEHPEPKFSGLIYIFVENVDDVAARIKTKTEIRWGPEDQEYGLREVGIKDNNGYFLVFAKEIK